MFCFRNYKGLSVTTVKTNKLFFLGFIVLLQYGDAVYGQNIAMPGRYTNANYFRDEVVKYNDSVIYGYAKDWKGNEVRLGMTIFFPELSYDSLKRRPLIVLVHGGSYFHGNKNDMYNEALILGKRGFVIACINYRLGWNSSNHSANRWDSSFYSAIYRSVQDSKAALRYLVRNAAQYGIDTSWMFIGGTSAGGATALHTAYYSQSTWDISKPWLRKQLGCIDSSSNKLNDKYTLKGVFDMWGGICDTTYITCKAATDIPILIFHGTADSIVPYTRPQSFEHSRMTPFYGGYLIAQRYKHLDACYELNTNINGRHGADFNARFLAYKIGVFCKNLLNGECKPAELTLEH
jgi:predicted esterase